MSDYFLPLYDWSLVPKETATFKGHYMQFCGSCCHVPYILHLLAFNTRKPQQSPPCVTACCLPYYHLHSIVTPRREMKVVSSFPTRVIIIQLYVLYFKLLIRGRERLQPSATSRKWHGGKDGVRSAEYGVRSLSVKCVSRLGGDF